MKKFFNRRIGPWEAVAVAAGIAALGWLGYAAFRYIALKAHEARVNAAFPEVLERAREQRQKIIKAIAAYKARFGVYPADHILSRRPLEVDAVTNWLAYDLMGVVYDPTNRWFMLGHMEPADAGFVTNFFHCGPFINCSQREDGVAHFLAPPPNADFHLVQFHDDPDVYALSFSASADERLDPGISWEYNASAWRYVSSAPTNNPGAYDLWIEIDALGRTQVVGNWKAVE